MKPTCCPETPVNNSKHALRNNSEETRTQATHCSEDTSKIMTIVITAAVNFTVSLFTFPNNGKQ
jgi:hypothetical protein